MHIYDKFKDTESPPDVQDHWPRLKLFYAFSGPKDRQGSFELWAKRVGSILGYKVEVIMADIVNNVDLADDHTWKGFVVELGPMGSILGSLWSPTCSTFSRARKDSDGGPRPLRGRQLPELLGLPGLMQYELEKVKLGTLLANRSGEGISAQNASGCPWLLENPEEDEQGPSIFNIPALKEAIDGHHKRVFPQCNVGAESVKSTEWRSSFELTHCPASTCSHPRVWWRQLPRGNWLRARHPPLKGKFRAVTPAVWEAMSPEDRQREERHYLTRAAAAYSSLLNCYLATQLVPKAAAVLASRLMVRTGFWRNVLVRNSVKSVPYGPSGPKGSGVDRQWDDTVDALTQSRRGPIMVDRLRHTAPDIKQQQNRRAIGGMRRPQTSVEKLPSLVPVGNLVRKVLDKLIDDNPEWIDDCVSAIGSDTCKGPTDAAVEYVRGELAAVLGEPDTGPVSKGDFSTELRMGLISAWATKAQDPDWAVLQWMSGEGVPAGLRNHPQDCGIFPRCEEEKGEEDPEDLATDFDNFSTYATVEEDDDAWAEIQRLTGKNWLKEFPTLKAVSHYLGEDPVMSKFGLIVKVRFDKVKKRLILDSKASGVSKVASKLERVILPRLLDAAYDLLMLLATGKEVEIFVLDFEDAFWILPLAANERKWFVSRVRGRYFVFLRNAQGSRNAPLGWGRLAALVGRLTQSVFMKDEVRIEIYTDDPFISIAGNATQRRRIVAVIVLIWRALGFPLSWRKGSLGRKATWIGGEFAVTSEPKGVTVKIKQELFDEARTMVKQFRSTNVIPTKQLRSATGKLANIANLLVAWRPFMGQLYAAIYDPSDSGAPINCIWAKQIRRSLDWFDTFFGASGGFIQRDFLLSAFMKVDSDIEFVLDASPWGLAGICYINGVALEYFSEALTGLDVTLFRHPIGEASGQQVWESLAALVALRLWRPLWNKSNTHIRVRGDSVAMLTLVVNMRPSSPQLSIIGQELALEFASATFVPVISEHIPGIANVAADKLSRWQQPNVPHELPEGLDSALRKFPPGRDRNYYLTLANKVEPNILGIEGALPSALPSLS